MSLKISKAIISENAAQKGGAFYIDLMMMDSLILIDNSTFMNNCALKGGILNFIYHSKYASKLVF